MMLSLDEIKIVAVTVESPNGDFSFIGPTGIESNHYFVVVIIDKSHSTLQHPIVDERKISYGHMLLE